MFKSCCTCPGKKMSKSKSKPENLDKNSTSEPRSTVIDPSAKAAGSEETAVDNPGTTVKPLATSPEPRDTYVNSQVTNVEGQLTTVEPQIAAMENQSATVEPPENAEDAPRSAGRRSIEFDRRRLSRDESKVLEELTQLEEDLARTNVDVRPVFGRRKSNGILKSTTSYGDPDSDKRPSITPSLKQDSCDDDDDEVFCVSGGGGPRREGDGTREPPATPVGRDELALRRHRFFSDLVSAARAAVEHRVRFDPLGPHVEDNACDPEALASLQGPAVHLEALIGRLERVTARLERLPQLRTRTPSPTPPATPPPASPLPPPPEDVAHSIAVDNMSVNGFEDIVQGPLQTYLGLSRKIGGDVATHANLVNAAFQAQLGYIHLAASRGKPSQSEEMNLLAPTSQQISAIQQFREKNRTSPFFNHLSAISESIPALGWVAISPAPSPYVKEMNDAGQFYTNRVLKEWKGKDANHAEWCRAWVQLLQELQAYVKQHHTTGLVWSGRGGGGCGAPPPPPPGGMPPPPPVLPPADFADLSIDDRSALFAQINQGENITSSLKKVTSEMQTHKNPTLRQGPAPYKPVPPPNKPFSKGLPAPGAGQLPEKPPVFTRDGKKWLIEYQRGNQGLVVENAEMNNVVYMFRCRDSALTVRGKINGVVLDSCTKCAVVFDNLVSSVEFVNCQSVQMQVLGKVPTISIDKTDGCQMYLSAQSLDVEIVSSKSSEMNVLVPKSNGDYTEFPVPEQFKTRLNTPRTGLATEPVESKG